MRLAREKMDGVLANLASANENTWMLIGTQIFLFVRPPLTHCRRRRRANARAGSSGPRL